MRKWMADIVDINKETRALHLPLNREINKREGYAIWHVEKEEYLFVDNGHIGWDTAGFYLISEKDMEALQELLWKRVFQREMPVSTTERQRNLYLGVFNDVDKVQVIPCVKYKGEESKLDFVNAFGFDGAGR